MITPPSKSIQNYNYPQSPLCLEYSVLKTLQSTVHFSHISHEIYYARVIELEVLVELCNCTS